jgi:hypothetical protein
MLRVCAARGHVCAARDCDRGGPYGPRVKPGASLARCGAARRAPACGSHRDSRCARGNSSGRSGTGCDNRRISRGEATTCRPSVSDRDDDKLARGANREHRVLTAGVHRLRASGCIPGALDLFGVLTRQILSARSSWPRLSCRLLDATVTARHGPVPKRHGQGGAIRIVIAILGGVWRPTQVGSGQPAEVDPVLAAAYATDVNRQNTARSACHQHSHLSAHAWQNLRPRLT